MTFINNKYVAATEHLPAAAGGVNCTLKSENILPLFVLLIPLSPVPSSETLST